MKPIACLTLLVLAACSGSDSPTEIRDSIAGTYTISAINGDAVPVHLGIAPEIDFVGGSITMREDGTVTLTSTILYYTHAGPGSEWVPDPDGPRTRNAEGTWTASGGTVSMVQTEPAGGNFLNWNGVRSGSALSLTRSSSNSSAASVGISTLTLSR